MANAWSKMLQSVKTWNDLFHDMIFPEAMHTFVIRLGANLQYGAGGEAEQQQPWNGRHCSRR